MLVRHERAQQAVAGLCRQLQVDTVPVVAADSGAPDVAVDPARYRLNEHELRQPISGYSGRLRAPRFTAVAVAAIAAADADFGLDLAAEASPAQLACAVHLRTVHAAARFRAAGIDGVGDLTAGMNVLWPTTNYDSRMLTAVAVWDLLPRADIAVIPTAAVDVAYQQARDMLGDDVLGCWQRLWRAAASGRPTPRKSPRVVDWLQLASRWLDLHDTTFPTLPVVPAPKPVIVAADMFTSVGEAAPAGQALSAAMTEAAAERARRDRGMAASIDTTLPSPGSGAAVGPGSPGLGGAGGAAGGSAVITWRRPVPADRENLRTLRDGLTVAGHRSPSMAPTPVRYPSGRLNPRRLVTRAGQIATGKPVTAAPWTSDRPVPRTSERLRLGVIVDASATMLPWSNVAAPMAWAAAHAVASRGGQHCLWAFGGEAFPVVAAGVAPPDVPVIGDRRAGSAGCGTAIADTTAMLGGDGAGLLIVITDGLLPDRGDVQDAVDDAVTAGFAVVWVMPPGSVDGLRPHGCAVVDDQSPGTLAATISTAAVHALATRSR